MLLYINLQVGQAQRNLKLIGGCLYTWWLCMDHVVLFVLPKNKSGATYQTSSHDHKHNKPTMLHLHLQAAPYHLSNHANK